MEQRFGTTSGTHPTPGVSGAVLRMATSPRVSGPIVAGVDQLRTTGEVCPQGQPGAPAGLRPIADKPWTTVTAVPAQIAPQLPPTYVDVRFVPSVPGPTLRRPPA